MKNLNKQDRSVARTATDVERRYNLQKINPLEEDVEELKKDFVVDTNLSASSKNAIANGTVTIELAKKVNREEGKGLSTNDFTNEDKKKLDEMQDTGHSHENKKVLDQITEGMLSNWGNIAYYESGGITDVDTTTEKLVLSKTNTPDTAFWFVLTFFYNKVSNNTNRAQVAISYNSKKPVMTRYYNNGIWSAWRGTNNVELNIGDYEGYTLDGDGVLEQWGSVTITPTSANTETAYTITFPKSYDYAPDINAVPQSATPNNVSWSVGAGATLADAKKSMVIYMTNTTTSAVRFRWRAKGFKKVF